MTAREMQIPRYARNDNGLQYDPLTPALSQRAKE